MSQPTDPADPQDPQAQPSYPPPPNYPTAPNYPPAQPNYPPPPDYSQQQPGYSSQQPGFPPPPMNYPPAPAEDPSAPPMAYGSYSAPPGMYFDPNSGLVLPLGVELASIGRRIGSYFLGIVLAIVTLVIGYIIWGLIGWKRGTSPAFQTLGMRVWRPKEQRVANWGEMALRDIVGTIATGILSIITELTSFILFVSGKERKSLSDHIGSTVVVYDPNKVLG